MVHQVLDGRYQIVQLIETGAYGNTYLAKDIHRPGEPLCFVKRLCPEEGNPQFTESARRLLAKEARILEKLGIHEQIPQLYAYFCENSDFFLIQSFVSGHCFRDEFIPGKPFSEEQVIPVLKSILEILKFIHQRDIIHGDIKPDNFIRRDTDYKLVLIDFISAQEINSELVQPLSGVRVGTLEYMALEQFQYQPRFNSDLYSLGMMMIQALTGLPTEELPKLHQNRIDYTQIVWRHLTVCSLNFAEIIDKMVEDNFYQRYQSAEEVLLDLEKLRQGITLTPISRDKNPLETYRQEVEKLASYRGEISVVGRTILDELRLNLGLSLEEIEGIEDQVLNPYRKYKEKVKRYEDALIQSMKQEYPFLANTRQELKELQRILSLNDDDIRWIEKRVLPQSLWKKCQSFGEGLSQKYFSTQRVFLQENFSKIWLNSSPDHSPLISPKLTPQKWMLLNRYIWVIFVLIFLGILGLIYQDLKRKYEEKILVFFRERNYQDCLNFSQTPSFFNQLPEIENLRKRCQDGLRWKNVESRDLGQLSQGIGAISFHPQGSILATGSQEGIINLWEINTRTIQKTLEGDGSIIWSLIFNSQGTQLIAGTQDWRILIWDLEEGNLIRTLEHQSTIWGLALSADGKILVSGSGDKTVKVWDLATGELRYTLPHFDSVYAVVLSPDGRTLVTGSRDQTLKIWNLETGQLQLTIPAHTQAIRSLALSPDGKLIISGSYDATLKIWDLKSGNLIRILRGHQAEVVSIAVSPDQKFIASGSRDKTIKIWELKTGELLNTLTGHTDEVYTLAFSPDHRTLASGGKDKTVKLWRQ